MGQRHNINPHQLTMFERAGDLADPNKTIHGDFDDYPEEGPIYSFDDFRSLKLREAKSRGYMRPEDAGKDKTLYDSIKREGVRNPVELISSEDLYGHLAPTKKPVLMEGHHRVFAQADINPDALVPVKWD